MGKECKRCKDNSWDEPDPDYRPDLTRYYVEERKVPGVTNPPYAVRTYYHPSAAGGVVCRKEVMLEPFGEFVEEAKPDQAGGGR